MEKPTAPAYPGSDAGPTETCRLADAYRRAAEVLRENGPRRTGLARAPYCLTAIHAIELYLNAFLLHLGHQARDVRGLQHDLAERGDRARSSGLVLKKRTADHLRSLTQQREYLTNRYAAMSAGKSSELTRLDATLREVSHKVTALLRQPADQLPTNLPPPPAPP